MSALTKDSNEPALTLERTNGRSGRDQNLWGDRLEPKRPRRLSCSIDRRCIYIYVDIYIIYYRYAVCIIATPEPGNDSCPGHPRGKTEGVSLAPSSYLRSLRTVVSKLRFGVHQSIFIHGEGAGDLTHGWLGIRKLRCCCITFEVGHGDSMCRDSLSASPEVDKARPSYSIGELRCTALSSDPGKGHSPCPQCATELQTCPVRLSGHPRSVSVATELLLCLCPRASLRPTVFPKHELLQKHGQCGLDNTQEDTLHNSCSSTPMRTPKTLTEAAATDDPMALRLPCHDSYWP